MASKERGTCAGVGKYLGFGLNVHTKHGKKEYSAREVNKIEHMVSIKKYETIT